MMNSIEIKHIDLIKNQFKKEKSISLNSEVKITGIDESEQTVTFSVLDVSFGTFTLIELVTNVHEVYSSIMRSYLIKSLPAYLDAANSDDVLDNPEKFLGEYLKHSFGEGHEIGGVHHEKWLDGKSRYAFDIYDEDKTFVTQLEV